MRIYPKYTRTIRLAYYQELTEETPEMWRETRPEWPEPPEPPFITIINFKDNNACGKEITHIPINELMCLFISGKSRYD